MDNLNLLVLIFWWSVYALQIKCKFFIKSLFYSKYPDTCVNQFPFERVITVKDLLAVVCRRAGDGKEDPDTLERNPKWLPVTYNLETEISKFVSYFQQRENK